MGSHPVPESTACVAANARGPQQVEAELRALNATLEQQVRQGAADLEAATRELDAFAYAVSHDLRSPVRAIDGFARILEEDYTGSVDAEGRDALQRVRAAAQKLSEQIDGLLKLSRISRAEMTPERVDLSRLAVSIADGLTAAAPERSVTFDIAPGMAAWGDRRLLTVVLEKLIGNAWKFTSTRPSARIEIGAVEDPGRRVYFVRDDGVGFDPASVPNLFAPFQRAHRENQFPGMGMGLATVRRIVRRHGGRAWAESAPGQGATVYFTLPAMAAEAQPCGGIPAGGAVLVQGET